MPLEKELSLKLSSLHSRSLLEILPVVRKLLFMESGILVNILTAVACRQETFISFFFFFPLPDWSYLHEAGTYAELRFVPKSRDQIKSQ